jgi:hypothetical protein
VTTFALARRASAALALSVTVLTADAAAQQSGRRPFASVREDEASAPTMTFVFAGSVHEGHGDEASGSDVGSGGRSPYYTGAQFDVAFTRRIQRLVLSADATGGARYHGDVREVTSVGRAARVGAELPIGRARLQASHAYRDNPFRQLLPQLGAEGEATRTASNPDTALSSTHNVQQASTVGWSRGLGRRSELAFNYGYATTRIGAGTAQTVQQGGSAFRHRVGRGLELKLGHQARLFEDVQHGPGERVIAHDLDLGIDLDRELSFSRRTRIGFTSGSSIVSNELDRRIVATGQASLRREIARSWNAVAAYARKVDFIEGLPDPVIGHTASFGVGGNWGRRFAVTLRGAAGSGAVGLDSRGTYRSITADTRGSLALGSALTWYVEHFYYQHTVTGAFLPAGVPPEAVRQGVRMGMDVKLDAIRRRR